jgi:hypothetical protein
MKPEDEKAFDENFDKLLAGCSQEVRDLLEEHRADYKRVCDEVDRGIKATDDMLKARLGPLYYFMVPQGKEIPLYQIRPRES